MNAIAERAETALEGRSHTGLGAVQRRAGVALSTVAVLFLLFDSVGKLLRVAPVVVGTTELGYPDEVVRMLGAILLSCLAIHLIPRLSVLGAVLLTGYLGGAVATHVRVGSPVPTHVLFPVYVAVCIWGGLWLRDVRVRRVFDART